MSHEISAHLSVFDPIFDLTRGDNSAKLSCPDILGLCSNFVESESLLESNFPDILALCETKFNEGYLPLNQKDSITHVHGLAVYVKEGLPFAWDLL